MDSEKDTEVAMSFNKVSGKLLDLLLVYGTSL